MSAFIFDLDGTLLDTLGDIGGACNAILKREGYPTHPIAAYRQMVGCGFAMLVRRAMLQNPAPPEDVLAQITAEAAQYYAQHMLEATRPYPQMADTVAKLADKGCPLAVLSNKPHAMTVEIIAHYFPHIGFMAVWGGREDMPLKPDPTALLAIMDNNDIAKADAYYVGDSDVDMLTSRNADVRGIGASWGFRGGAELAAAGAWRILQEPAQLLELA